MRVKFIKNISVDITEEVVSKIYFLKLEGDITNNLNNVYIVQNLTRAIELSKYNNPIIFGYKITTPIREIEIDYIN